MRRRLLLLLAVSVIAVGGGAVVAVSPAWAGVGNCTDYKFMYQAPYYLDSIHRGVPPQENDRYLYGIYWTGYDGVPNPVKVVCGPV